METKISFSIKDIKFNSCIYNAAGPLCTTEQQLIDLGKSKSGAIVTKSCTLEKQAGNPKPKYHDNNDISINSNGLENEGHQFYINIAPTLKQFNKPIILSVSGKKLADNIEIIKNVNKSEYDLIELNLSCPNVPGKPQVGYDFEQTENVLKEIMTISKKPLGVKLPPYFDIIHMEQISELLKKHKVAFATCINSLGNTLVIDSEKEQVTIHPKEGFGGLGGKFLKPVGLSNVRMLSKLTGIPIIGVGGITTGTDAFEYILAGATAVQLGTQFQKEGTNAFERIESELKQIMQRKGYTSLEDFRGKLKTLDRDDKAIM